MRVPSPNFGTDGYLLSVTGASADSAWAVGVTDQHAVLLRWNGATWTHVPDPAGNDLYRVAAISADSAWAFAYTFPGGDLDNPVSLIMHWNGATWTQVPSPNPGLSQINTVAAASADSAWAIGYFGSGTSRSLTEVLMILHWNGAAWTRCPTRAPDWTARYIDSVAACAGRQRLGGRRHRQRQAPDPELERHGLDPGAQPQTGRRRLFGVTALSGNDAWAVGIAGGKTLIQRWNGQTWSGPAGQVSPTAAPTPSLASSGVASPVSSGVPSPASSAVASPASSAVASPGLPARQQAAQALAGLLAQSGTDRTAITQAVNAVAACSSWPEPGRDGLQQRRVVASGPAGQARRAA